jgi:hypothetical protein
LLAELAMIAEQTFSNPADGKVFRLDFPAPPRSTQVEVSIAFKPTV